MLTTVQTAPSLPGEVAARLLLDVIDGSEAVDATVLAASLVVRTSTAPVGRS
ncbi:hypothetical protein V2J94_17280 [Streptomyces sp. DSM 41524]|uniref:LacI family transcriptional regulator n=1 Tax=Streptomyces asiaticus subsp. ignotus TaxID=3098222 RepID=A0ABU7PX06_9ACTN|nr:hypothetical protein [Streptomyces sp. DSM 41524]